MEKMKQEMTGDWTKMRLTQSSNEQSGVMQIVLIFPGRIEGTINPALKFFVENNNDQLIKKNSNFLGTTIN